MFKRDNLEYEFLPAALEVEETPTSPLGAGVIWIVTILVVAAVIWSYLGRIDEVAITRGKVIPDGRVKVIQPLEEGSIKAIHVQEGQRVKAGDLLIELDSTIKQADVTGFQTDINIHRLEKEVLTAELQGRGFDEYLAGKQDLTSKVTPAILQLQRQNKAASEAAFTARAEALQLSISQREKELESEKIALATLEKKYQMLQVQDQENPPSNLKNESAVLNQKMELFSAEQAISEQKQKINRAQDALDEAKKNLNTIEQEREKELLKRIMETEKRIAAVESELVKAQKKYEFQTITAPVDGTIHGLSSYTIGGIVTPAQPIVTIVPEGMPLIIESTVLNKDIGFIHLNQQADIKLDTFPFQKYGSLPGEVVFISPDAFEDEQLGPVYKIKVKLKADSLNVEGKDIKVSPGMSVSAEVKTGQRRIIEFFLSPLVKYAKESLTLR